MPTEIDKFMLSLAAAIGTAALAGGTTLEFASTPRAIWSLDAEEGTGLSTDPFTVLRVYGGTERASFKNRRRARASVQIDTRGTKAHLTLARAWAIHETLLDAHGRPQLNWQIPAKRMSAAGAIENDSGGNWIAWVCDLTGVPGIVGGDEKRHFATSNFEIEFERAA